MVVWLYVGWHAEHKHEHDDGEEVENCILFLRFLIFIEAWTPALANFLVEAAGAVASAGVCCSLPVIGDGDLAVLDGGVTAADKCSTKAPTIAPL